MAVPYTPRAPTAGVLHDVVRRHLATFLATVAARTDGAGVPGFVAREFRAFLGCGMCSRHTSTSFASPLINSSSSSTFRRAVQR